MCWLRDAVIRIPTKIEGVRAHYEPINEAEPRSGPAAPSPPSQSALLSTPACTAQQARYKQGCEVESMNRELRHWTGERGADQITGGAGAAGLDCRADWLAC